MMRGLRPCRSRAVLIITALSLQQLQGIKVPCAPPVCSSFTFRIKREPESYSSAGVPDFLYG